MIVFAESASTICLSKNHLCNLAEESLGAPDRITFFVRDTVFSVIYAKKSVDFSLALMSYIQILIRAM